MKPLRYRWLQKLRALLAGGLVLLLTGLVFYLGIRSERSGFVRKVLQPGFHLISEPVLNAFRGGPPPVHELQLVLDSGAFDDLMERGERAIADGLLITGDGHGASARLLSPTHDLSVIATLRKGRMPSDRLRNWPLHVRILTGDTVMGMNAFDALPVVDEMPLWSMLLHALLEDQGQPALMAGLADLTLNGRSFGLCALMESPDRSSQLRWASGGAAVLRFDDALYLNACSGTEGGRLPYPGPPQCDWLSAPLLVELHPSGIKPTKAVQQLEALRAGSLPPSAVFDGRDLARAMALSDLLGTADAMDWWNLRFVVDSSSEKMILIPLHATGMEPLSTVLAEEVAQNRTRGREFIDLALNDAMIRPLYVAYLDTFSSPGWLEAAMERTRFRWEPARKAVHAGHPHIDLDLAVIDHDRMVMRQAIAPRDLVLAYRSDTLDARNGVSIANVHALAVEVAGVVLMNGDTIRMKDPLVLSPRKRDHPLRYVFLPLPAKPPPCEVLVRLAAGMPQRPVRIRSWSSFGSS